MVRTAISGRIDQRLGLPFQEGQNATDPECQSPHVRRIDQYTDFVEARSAAVASLVEREEQKGIAVDISEA